MSETPRTDEHLRRKEENGHVAIVSRDFARQLETELAEAWVEIERLKETAEIETILAVTDMYYAAKCNHCGWIGSSKLCVEAWAGCADDCKILCPLCFRHISDDDPSLKDVAEFLNRDVIKFVERKDKLIEQMWEALLWPDLRLEANNDRG